MMYTTIYRGTLHTVQANWNDPNWPVVFDGAMTHHKVGDFADGPLGAMRGNLTQITFNEFGNAYLTDAQQAQIERACAAMV